MLCAFLIYAPRSIYLAELIPENYMCTYVNSKMFCLHYELLCNKCGIYQKHPMADIVVLIVQEVQSELLSANNS
jgi:hypothetical protein